MSPAFRPHPLRLVRGQEPQSDECKNEGRLLESLRQGEASAPAAFHDRVRPVVDRTLGRLLGTRDPDYDDLAQQALIELVLSVDRFRGDCPLDAWISIVTARVVYRHIRRRRIERRLFVLERAESAELPDRAAPSGVMMRSAIRRVEGHLRHLDPKKAWTFLLHDVHGYDLAEVSAITGVSRTAAQSRLVRGRAELHAKIAADPELASLLAEKSRSEGAS